MVLNMKEYQQELPRYQSEEEEIIEKLKKLAAEKALAKLMSEENKKKDAENQKLSKNINNNPVIDKYNNNIHKPNPMPSKPVINKFIPKPQPPVEAKLDDLDDDLLV